MSERNYDLSTAQSETLTPDAGLLTGRGAPNGAHRWIRLQGLSGAMGNGAGQTMLEEAGGWATTPYWKKGTGVDEEAANAMSATPDLLVRHHGGSVLVIRAPLGYQSNAVLVDMMFEDIGAQGCAPYDVVTQADPNYALYLVLVLDREGVDWSAYHPELADRAMAALGPEPVAEAESSNRVDEPPSEWEDNKTVGAVEMAGMAPGPWAPPGRQPIPLYVGREVHEVIAEEYRDVHQGEDVFTNHIPVRSILESYPGAALNKLTEQERLLKPDIANLTRLHLYEIKSEAEAPAGAAKLATYLGVFNAAGIPMQPGPVTEPGTFGVLPAPAGFVVYNCFAPGLIVYQYRRALPEPVPVGIPIGVPAPEGSDERVRRITDWRYWEELTGLTGAALVLYLLVSEGSRILPARNLIPVP